MLQDGATGGEVTSEQIGWYGGIVFSIFLIGWAMGDIGFSMAAGYFGHTKLLIATIVIYAVFTGLTAGALFGDLGFGPLAERFGRRPVFGLMCLGSLLLLTATYFVPHRYAEGVVLLPVLGFFNNGIFSGFPILPPRVVPDAAPCHRRRILFQRRPHTCLRRALRHRLARDQAGTVQQCRECYHIDLPAWLSHTPIRNRNQRETVTGVNSHY